MLHKLIKIKLDIFVIFYVNVNKYSIFMWIVLLSAVIDSESHYHGLEMVQSLVGTTFTVE